MKFVTPSEQQTSEEKIKALLSSRLQVLQHKLGAAQQQSSQQPVSPVQLSCNEKVELGCNTFNVRSSGFHFMTSEPFGTQQTKAAHRD